MSAARRLAATARELIDTPHAATRSLWARGAAFLGRQALEEAMQELWLARARGVEATPFTTQLVCLGEVLDDAELGHRATWVWNALSRACHHHGYALPPTASQLHGWLNAVDAVIEAVDAR